MATIKLDIRKYHIKNKSSEIPLYIRLTIDRKVRYYNTGIKIIALQWKNSNVVGKGTKFQRTRLLIDKKMAHAQEVLYQSELRRQHITFEEFERQFSGTAISSTDFYEFAQSVIKQKQGLVSEIRIYSYRYVLDKLKRFAPTLHMDSITLDFVKDYDRHLRVEKGLKQNTIYAHHVIIKTILRFAYEGGVFDERNNPYRIFKPKQEDSKRPFLEYKELLRIEKLLDEDIRAKRIQTAIPYFLFSCFTGLRYSDIATLQWDEVKENILYFRIQKTQKTISVPLTDKARRFLPKERGKGLVFPDIPSVMSMDNALLRMEKLLKLDKHVSFHIARHTFATVSLQLGIPIEVVSKLLGHTNLKTTQIYAKIVDNMKIEHMQKWNNL